MMLQMMVPLLFKKKYKKKQQDFAKEILSQKNKLSLNKSSQE